MPFYAFGPLKIVPVRTLGSAGPLEGPPVMVDCPLRDSLRSVYPWLALPALLLLRRNNRNRRAWAVLLPLLAIYGILHVVESRPDGTESASGRRPPRRMDKRARETVAARVIPIGAMSRIFHAAARAATSASPRILEAP